MRWALGLMLCSLGCDSFASPAPWPHDGSATAGGVGGTKAPSDGAAGLGLVLPPELMVEPPVIEPEPDWCTVAKEQGATFCERRTRALEYCVPALAPPPSEGGAAGVAGAGGTDAGAGGAEAAAGGAEAAAGGTNAGAGGTDAGAGGTDAGAGGTDAGAAGAPGQVAECAQFEWPPQWVYDLVIECVAHCGVGIRNSERQLEGSCCYLAESEYYGR